MGLKFLRLTYFRFTFSFFPYPSVIRREWFVPSGSAKASLAKLLRSGIGFTLPGDLSRPGSSSLRTQHTYYIII